MIFTQFIFFLFFGVVFCVYWKLPSYRLQKYFLLAASYFFYAAWDWRFLGLIIASTLLDFWLGKRIASTENKRNKRRLLSLSLLGNLGTLAYFKYCNFFLGSAADLLKSVGFDPHIPTLEIALPVGISFYTFQTLSYSIDVYRGILKPRTKISDFALFVAFFPQLVAGPIVRATEFLPQLDKRRQFSDVPVQWALSRFLIGYFKKACIADNISPVVDHFFADPTAYGTSAAWLAIVLYTVQVYCDFSGYSDMAIGTARLLGFSLPENFTWPYLQRNIGQYWAHWHITMSQWIRDYIFFATGGMKLGRGPRAKLALYKRLFVVFLLIGLWHGAGWKFVLYGMIHAVAIISRREWGLFARRRKIVTHYVFGWALTMFLVVVARILFRSTDFAHAAKVAGVVFLGDGGDGTIPLFFFYAIVPLFAIHWISYKLRNAELEKRVPPISFAAAYGVAWAVALFCSNINVQPFIYFQF